MDYRMNRRKKGSPGHTPLSKHSKKGSTLQAPISSIGSDLKLVDWARDLLPEFLWIGALAQEVGVKKCHVYYNEFLDVFDEYWPSKKHVAWGLLSDFKILPEDIRKAFIDEHEEMIEELFYKPVGKHLSYYPDNPASWLLLPSFKTERLDPEEDLSKLRSLVVRLLPGIEEFAARVRLLPSVRQIKNGKIRIQKDMDIVDQLRRYPNECTEEEKSHVESFCRSMFNACSTDRPGFKAHEWSKFFWRHNYELVTCRIEKFPIRKHGSRTVSTNEKELLESILDHNKNIVKNFLSEFPSLLKCDLYDPSRDEVMFGLFSRLTRLYYSMLDDPTLWARDLSGIFLRCLADTAITFSYLAVAGREQDFQKFVQYGEGQAKLLMLHLQDNYPDQYSFEGHTAADISEDLGRFTPEIINVELGNWSGMDARKLAKKAGMERLYRLVYSPASSDVHGSWLSLKNQI